MTTYERRMLTHIALSFSGVTDNRPHPPEPRQSRKVPG
jgi:hypothetical protein